MGTLRRFTDGVLFQAVLTGSLSFSHIHDLAAAHGQAGWKAWLYPLSVDLLTVAAYRKLITAKHEHAPTGFAWVAFLLGLAASLAANVAGAWENPDRLVAVSLGVWPAVAFLVCTLLSHDTEPAAVEATAPVQVPAPVVVESAPPAEPAAPAVPVVSPAPVVTAAVVPAPVPAPAPAPAPVAPVVPELSGVAPAFLAWARRVADEHHAAHGAPIDAPTLRARLKVAEPLATAVHTHLMTAGA